MDTSVGIILQNVCPFFGYRSETIAKIQNKESFFAANSVPCFEYWLLLHFKDSTKPYSNKGNSSIANEVLKDLKLYLPNYAKGTKDIFYQTQQALNFAINNAKQSLDQATKIILIIPLPMLMNW